MSIIDQYKKIKNENKNYIIFFQIGEFYEIFLEDATIISDKLNLILTSKKINNEQIPMCGLPKKALNKYLSLLIEESYKILIVEEIKKTGNQVARDVTKKITPGTIIEESLINDFNFRIIISITNLNAIFFTSLIDLSCGLFELHQLKNINELINFIKKYNPKEVIVTQQVANLIKSEIINLITISSTQYNKIDALSLINQYNKDCYNKINLFNEGFIYSIFILFDYIYRITNKENIILNEPTEIKENEFMYLSSGAIKNLEIFTTYGNKASGSLLNHINKATTAIGKRKLKMILLKPLTNEIMINHRLDVVEYFFQSQELSNLEKSFKTIGDPERYLIRFLNKLNKEDLLNLHFSSNGIIEILEMFLIKEKKLPHILIKIKQNIFKVEALLRYLSNNITQEQILCKNDLISAIKLTCIISLENNAVLQAHFDDLNNLLEQIIEITDELQRNTKNKIGITWNEIYGFILQLTKENFEKLLIKVKDIKIISQEKKIEFNIDTIENINKLIFEKIKYIKSIERKYLSEIQKMLSLKMHELFDLFDDIATLDVLFGFYKLSKQNNYKRIKFVNEKKTEIIKCSHPILHETNENIVKNNLALNEKKFLYLITGPNMGGKSIFLKQNALIIIMSQIGMFVPIEFGEINIKDKIFTRIGSEDEVRKNKSTFYVEMEELFDIFENATENSFCIFDEFCRSTNPEEGIIIAKETINYILEKIKCHCIFATHFHKLQEIKSEHIEHFAISHNEKYKLSKDKTTNSESIDSIKKFNFKEEFIKKIEFDLQELYSKKN